MVRNPRVMMRNTAELIRRRNEPGSENQEFKLDLEMVPLGFLLIYKTEHISH